MTDWTERQEVEEQEAELSDEARAHRVVRGDAPPGVIQPRGKIR
jgi:hypothetical protein